MATEPTNPIIRIAEYDTVLPSTGLTNKLEPVTSVKQTGFDANILLSAENLNYILDNIGEWLQYCKDVADSQITVGDGLDSDAGTIGEGQTISVDNSVVRTARDLTAGDGLTGGGDLSSDRTFTLGIPSTLSGATENTISPSSHTHKLDIATLSEARLGISNTKIMTPYLVKSSFNMVGMIVYGAFPDQLSGEDGWLKANGAAVSRTTYGDLFAKIGTVFGSGDGSTTFNLPDLRGEFIRGWDDGRGIDSGRAFGSWQKGSIVGYGRTYNSVCSISSEDIFSQNLSEMRGRVGADTHDISAYQSLRLSVNGGASDYTLPNGGTTGSGGTGVGIEGGFSGVVRPRNIALTAWIRY